jgi:phage terminase Nu1 subunit (DNA packaging protein)
MTATQASIGIHLDLDQSSVSRLCKDLGIDHKTASLAEIRIAYIRHLREQAAGRLAAGDLDLATERAGLAKAQRERIEMQNAVTRREMAPTYLIEEILAAAGAKVAAILDAIPGACRRRNQNLTAADIQTIAGEIAKARNVAAAISLDQLEAESQAAAVELEADEP